MLITRQVVADQIKAYLERQSSLEQLVNWAEGQMMEGEFESAAVRDAVAHLGLADVRAFGLQWEDCRRILNDLGFAAHVEIAAAS
jgi:hypothetical protein